MSTNPLAQTSFAHQRRHAGRSALRRVVPHAVRQSLRLGCLMAFDLLDLCLGRKRSLSPPRWMNFAGDGDFQKTGEEFFRYFTGMGGLEPFHNVLEVGCGIGRMARPLTGYLSGSYEGFDIVPAGIKWCQKNISPRHPNFHFTLADIYNREYNPAGTGRASDYSFPYPDSSFDFAFLTSVFTHMIFAEVDHYLGELSRVLAPGGRCLATFFLLNDESRHLMATGCSSLEFRYPLSRGWTTNPQVPETAMAYEEKDLVAALLAANGFVLESVNPGRWCGRTKYLSYQDIVVFRKAFLAG